MITHASDFKCFQPSNMKVNSYSTSEVILFSTFNSVSFHQRRSQWPRRLRCGSAASHPLGLRVRKLRSHGYLSHVCYALLGRGLSVPGSSLIQKNPTECGMSVIVKPR